MSEEKITIIIPVYKVEPYLRNCLDSVIGQTYKNLEIILVDDGSPDDCGNICDEYAAKDDRIKVIHQENGGLSAARNAGLKIATGDYLGFVDSDDWIEPDMYEYLIENLRAEQADIAVCGHDYGRQSLLPEGPGIRGVFKKEEALGLLLEDEEVRNFVWDKMYRRSLFDGIKFLEGITYEDVEIMHRLFERADQIVCLPDAKYHYRQRSDSIMNDVSLANRFNYYNAAWKRYEDMKKRWPQFSQQLEGQCVRSAIGIWCSYLRNDPEERKKYEAEIQHISQFSKLHYKSALPGLGKAGRFVVVLTQYTTWWAFFMARLCGWAYKVKRGREL